MSSLLTFDGNFLVSLNAVKNNYDEVRLSISRMMAVLLKLDLTTDTFQKFGKIHMKTPASQFVFN